MRNRGTFGLSLALVVLGVAVVARTIAAGIGGGVGLVLGGVLLAAGVARLYLSLR